MRIGTFRHRITLLQKSDQRDEAGQPIDAYVELRKTWANISFTSGREAIRTEKSNWQPQASCRIRPQDVLPDMRVEYKGDIYDVTSVIPNDKFYDLVIQRIPIDG